MPRMPTGSTAPSGTPLPAKLGLREGSRLYVIGAPAGFAAELAPMPTGVRTLARPGVDLDVVVLFAVRAADLRRRFGPLARRLRPAGRLWVAWPKKAAGMPTDLDFAIVQSIGLDAGLVDNKSASITEAFQGLQFVLRLRDRPR